MPIEQPKITQRGEETIASHPAFGQIGASRVSGHSALYDSEFRHHNYITVSIHRSRFHRGLSWDWHYAEDELIEVKLSEAQWATFVSAMNVGSGVPCTINHLAGKQVPDLPDPEPPTLQFQEEMRKTLEASTATLQKLIEAIDEMGLPKGKADAIKSQVRHSMMQINSNAPFVAKSFGEHMEKTVEKAKAEVHGYMTHVIQRAGLEAITGGQLPLQIERKA